VDGLERQRLRRLLALGQRLAADMRRDPADDLDQAGASGVDDARLAKNVQLLRRSRERFLPGGDDLGERVRERNLPRGKRLGALGQRPRDGENGAFLGPADGSVGSLAGATKGDGHGARIELVRARQDFERAADELGENYSRVAARAHEDGPGDIGVPVALESGDGSAHRLGHVRPRVAVRDRIDVEIVDAGATGLDACERRSG
jgi:hypothetical protein